MLVVNLLISTKTCKFVSFFNCKLPTDVMKLLLITMYLSPQVNIFSLETKYFSCCSLHFIE